MKRLICLIRGHKYGSWYRRKTEQGFRFRRCARCHRVVSEYPEWEKTIKKFNDVIKALPEVYTGNIIPSTATTINNNIDKAVDDLK